MRLERSACRAQRSAAVTRPRRPEATCCSGRRLGTRDSPRSTCSFCFSPPAKASAHCLRLGPGGAGQTPSPPPAVPAAPARTPLRGRRRRGRTVFLAGSFLRFFSELLW